jgi:hypothetical protein
MERGTYGEIKLSTVDAHAREQINELVDAANTGAAVDEHGAWKFGIQASNRRGTRGVALNWDCYGFGRDLHSGDFLAVIQVRQTSWNKYGNSSRKSYFLLGRNEDDSVFAHCVESRVIHDAIAKGRDVVLAVQSWMFGGDYAKVLRQGDIALVPVRSPKGDKTDERAASIGSSHGFTHLLQCDEVRRNDHLYALNPTLTHNPGTHHTISGQGWFKVVNSNRARYWDFSKTRVD